MKKTKQAKRLLRLINDIDDCYILETLEGEQKQTKEIGEIINYRVVFRWGVAAVACLTIILGGRNLITSPIDPPNDLSVFEGNPIQEVSSMDEAKVLIGFGMEVPEPSEPYIKKVISVLNGSSVDVSYQTMDGNDEGYVIRKALGTDDISGDYEEYEHIETMIIGEYEVVMKGNGESISLATWNSGKYTYAVCAQNHPVLVDQMRNIISDID